MNRLVQKVFKGGRPLEFDPERTGESLVRLFWRKGFLGASLSDIESSTGLSRSSLYNSFGSKQDIFEKALARYCDAIDDRMCKPLEAGGRGLEDIAEFLDSLAPMLTNPKGPSGCLMVNSMVEFGGKDGAVARHGARHLGRLRAAFDAALQRAVNLGEIPRQDTAPRADLLLSLVLGVSVAARAGLPRGEIDALVAGARAQVAEWSR